MSDNRRDAVLVWARSVVWVIPAAVALTIVLNIFSKMFSKDHESVVADERDRKFQLRGMATTIVFVGLGYMVMLTGLAIGWPTLLALNILFFSAALGDLMGNIVRLYSYKLGA